MCGQIIESHVNTYPCLTGVCMSYYMCIDIDTYNQVIHSAQIQPSVCPLWSYVTDCRLLADYYIFTEIKTQSTVGVHGHNVICALATCIYELGSGLKCLLEPNKSAVHDHKWYHVVSSVLVSSAYLSPTSPQSMTTSGIM